MIGGICGFIDFWTRLGVNLLPKDSTVKHKIFILGTIWIYNHVYHHEKT